MRSIGLCVLVAVSGCVKFDYEAELFSCESNDDCDADAGYVCAGFAADSHGAVKSYCVLKKDRQLAVSLTTKTPFAAKEAVSHDPCEPVDGEKVVAEPRFAVEMADEDNTNAENLGLIGPSDPSAVLSDDTTCVGGVDVHGVGTFTCIAPWPKDPAVVGMAIALVAGEDSVAPLPGTVYALAFGKALTKSSTYRYDLGTVGVFDLDLPSADRCDDRAAMRHLLCSSDPLPCDCVVDDEADPCPVPYYCAADLQCYQVHELEKAAPCAEAIAMSCASETCTANACE